MTVKQIVSDVRELSGEGSYASDGLIIAALNTALSTIYAELGITARAHIFLHSVGISKRISMLSHVRGGSESIDLEGIAFGFAAYGNGYATVSDSVGTRTYKFNGNGVEIYGHIAQGGTVTFGGEYSYTVRDLCFFTELEGGDIPSISRSRSVRLDRAVDDFSSAVSGAESSNGDPLPLVRIDGCILTAPSDLTGEVCFTYKKRAPRITADSMTDTLPLPSPAISALVALSVAYVLRGSATDGEDFFMSEYRRLTDLVRRSGKTSRSGKYLDLTGWA